MIQDIFPHKLDNHFYPARIPNDNSYVMAFRSQDILVKGVVVGRFGAAVEGRSGLTGKPKTRR